MKTLTAIIVSGIFALSATACTCNSGLFGGKTVKASRNYVTKNIKVHRSEPGRQPECYLHPKGGKTRSGSVYFRQYRRPSGHQCS